MDTPVLWQFTSSHFNEKARWALDYKRVRHIRRSLVPGFHVFTIKRMTGKTHVPVLQLNGKTISDSSRIIEELERAFPGACPLSRRRRRTAQGAGTRGILRRGAWPIHPPMVISFDAAVPRIHPGFVCVSRKPGDTARASRDDSAYRHSNETANEHKSCHCRGSARQDDCGDGPTGKGAAAVGLPGGGSLHGGGSHGGGAAFSASETAGVSVSNQHGNPQADG